MLIAKLFVLAKNGKQPKGSSVYEWVNKLWYTHPGEYDMPIKRNKVHSLPRWLRWWECCPLHQNCCWSHPQSGHIPRLQVHSPIGAHMGGKQWMFLYHINVSLCVSPPLSLKSINISSGED